MSFPLPPQQTRRYLTEFLPDRYTSYCRNIYLGAPHVDKGVDLLIPASRLAQHKEYLLATIRQYYAGDDERALMSQWCKYYFSLVIPPAVVVALVLRRPLHMALNESELVLRHGMPYGLWLSEDALGEIAEDPAIRYRSLCVEHLALQITALATTVRLSPRVLWNNAGHTLEYALFDLGQDEYAKQDASFLFERANFFDSQLSNPLRHVVRYVQAPSPQLPTPLRVRRVCCLRYKLPGEEMLCTSCPRLLTLCASELEKQIRLMQTGEAE